jgi:hypothetical protein
MAKSEIMQNCPFALLIYINVDIQFNILAKPITVHIKTKASKKERKVVKVKVGTFVQNIHHSNPIRK